MRERGRGSLSRRRALKVKKRYGYPVAGGEGLFVATDVSQADQVKELIERTMQKFGRLDFASTMPDRARTDSFLEQDEETTIASWTST